jgi:aryl-alcohol dehydrogenase
MSGAGTTKTSATAAVLRGPGEPFSFEQVTLAEPQHDELQVRISSVGICHTDLSVVGGTIPAPLPMVLGHEGAGIVEQVGSSVTGFAVGDRVALSFASCGHCASCLGGREAYCVSFARLNFAGRRDNGTTTMLDSAGAVVNGSFFGQSSFATHAVVAARNAVKVPDGIDLDLTGPLGCGVQTGAGTVINTLKLTAGSTIVVAGTGAVGLSAIMAAAASGATKVIAVDVLESRLEKALELGATHAINGRADDVVEQILGATGGGVDFAVDTTAVPGVISNVMQATRSGGGVALLGVGKPDAAIPVLAMSSKTIYNVVEGDAIPQTFIPQLIAMHERGVFPFDKMVTTYPFGDIEQAVADTRSGAAVKAVLVMDR